MDELFVNTTAYYILSIIVYLFIFIYGVLLNINSARSITLEITGKLRTALASQKPVIDTYNIFKRFLILPILNILFKLFQFIFFIADHIYKAEYYFITNILPELAEPVNYASLILRKCYTNNHTALITASALFFVVFYFILSIF